MRYTLSMGSSPTSPKAPARLLLVDGLNVLRRVYEANDLPESPEKAKGAVKAALGSFRRAFNELAPTHALIAFDAGGETWRHRLHPEYKSSRPPMPEVLRPAMAGFIDHLRIIGINVQVVPDVEADDVLAAAAHRAAERKCESVVLSTDQGLLSLLSLPNTRVRDHFRYEWRDAAWCERKYGLPPQLMEDARALTGEPENDIPGIQGVGMKTAARLLREHGSLNALLEASGELVGTVGKRIHEGHDTVRLARRLVSLKSDVPIQVESWGELRVPRDIEWGI
jgi:protein Xni